MNEIAGVKIGAAGPLSRHDFVGLLDQGRDKPQGNGHHHGQFMDGNMDLLQRIEQLLQPVGEHDRGGGIGQQKGAGDQHHNAPDHKNGVADSLPGDGKHPERDHRITRRVKDVQDCGDDQNNQNRFQAAQKGLWLDAGDCHAQTEQGEEHNIGNDSAGQEQRHDIENGQQQLGPRVHAVNRRIAGEKLPQRNILERHSPHPLSKLGQNRIAGLLHGVHGGINVHTCRFQPVEYAGHSRNAKAHGFQFRTVGKDLPRCA